MEEIQEIKQKLSNIEQSIKASAPLATSSPRSGLTEINRSLESNNDRAIDIDKDFSLAVKECSTTPNSEQLINLSLAGLGKKRVVFSDKNGDHYFFQETLEKNFPKLKKLEGTFALYRAASGGSGCRQLLKIPMGQGGYSLEWLRVSCSVGSSSTLYVVPKQQDLDVGLADEEQEISVAPKAKCCFCNKLVSLINFRFHTTKCEKQVKDESQSHHSISSYSASEAQRKESIGRTYVFNKSVDYEKKEVCPDCGATVDNGWCIKCEQDEAYQRAFEIDLMKDHNYHTQKSSAEDEDQFKIEEEVVRSKRLTKFGEHLPKKAKLEKETSSDAPDFDPDIFFNPMFNIRHQKEEEVVPAPTAGSTSDSNDNITHDEAIPDVPSESTICMILKIRRSLLIQDMIREFKDSKIIDKKLKLVVTSLNGQEELGDDFGGVLRDILSAFWSEFFKGHATGDTEMVPYLRHEFGATEWAAIARIIVKGYNDVGYYPITINKAFMVSCVFGEQAVSEEMYPENNKIYKVS